MKKTIWPFGLFIFSSLSIVFATAPTLAIQPSEYAGMRWRMIGPYHGGRATAVTGVPSQPDVFYLGAAGGGLWKSSDAGHSWNPIFDGQPVASIGAVAVAPSNPKILYVGTGESDMRSSIVGGDGMYKSVDAGKHWKHIGLTDSQQIARIIIDPVNPDIVFVAALGHAYAANVQRGVFRTVDGGRTWQKILYKNANTGAIDLAMDPRDHKIIYAALWQTRRPPWNVYPPSNGPGSGLYKTIDGGSTWRELSNGVPRKGLGRIGIAIAPSKPDRLYALIDAKKGGLYRSEDAGAHWKLVNDTDNIWNRGWYFAALAVDPRDANTVWVGNIQLYKSTSAGKKLKANDVKTNAIGDYHSLWIDPQDPQRMIVGADQGAIVSINGGKNWTTNLNEPLSEFYRIATDNQIPYWVWGAQQDSGAMGLPSRTDHGSIGYHDLVMTAAGGESGYIAPDPRHPRQLFGVNDQSVNIDDLDTGQTADVSPNIAFPGLHRKTWTLPIVFSKRDPNVLYFSEEHLFRSPDHGQTWQVISPDLTRPHPGVPSNLDATTANDLYGRQRRGVIFTIAPSPISDGEIWVGTNDGKIWLTSDEGAHWADVTPPSVGAWSKVTLIEASPHDSQTAYAAIDRHRLDDFKPYVYKTHDGGRTWTLAVSGIPANSFINGIREDAVRPGLLYAATETGVYVSFNDGGSWHPLRLNMPVVSVRDLAVNGDDLIIATHGRSWWILDDLTPLRQLTEAVERSPVWLFKPQTTLRFHEGFNGYAQDEPEFGVGKNPPQGAVIDYYVGPHTRGPVKLQIHDSAGNLVRRFASTDKKPKASLLALNPDKASYGTLSDRPGMHRFTWDFAYTPPAHDEPGVISAPGQYQLTLSANGRVRTATLTLLKDPRVAASDADLVAQFNAARALARLSDQIRVLNKDATKEKKRLALVEKKGTARERKSARRLKDAITALVGAAPVAAPDDTDGPPEPILYTIHYVSVSLATVQGAIEAYDAAPAPYMLEAIQRNQATLSRLSTRLRSVLRDAAALAPSIKLESKHAKRRHKPPHG